MNNNQTSSKTTPLFFYGWWMVVIGFFCMALSLGFVYYTFGVFIVPLEQTFKWSRWMITLAQIVWAVVAVLITPRIGAIVDRYGARAVMSVGGIILAFGLFLLTMTWGAIWWYCLSHAVIAAGVSGLSFVPVHTVILRWFQRSRGLAVGITTGGGAIGGYLGNILLPRFISNTSWRWGYGVIAIASLFVAAAAWLVVRRAPEDLGLRAYGEGDTSISAGDGATKSVELPQQPVLKGVTLQEAWHLSSFWILAFFMFAGNFAYNCIQPHYVAYMVGLGFTSALAGGFIGNAILLSLPGKIAGGAIADYVNNKLTVSICLFGFAIAGLSLFAAQSSWQHWAFIFLWGIPLGISAGIQPLLLRSVFGNRSFGVIYGNLMRFQIVGASTGPFFGGWIFDVTKSYYAAFTISIAIYVLCAVLILFVQPRFKE